MADIINACGDVITAGGCQFGICFGMSYYNSYLDEIMPYVKPEYRKGWEARYYNGYNEMLITDDIKGSKKPTHFLAGSTHRLELWTAFTEGLI